MPVVYTGRHSVTNIFHIKNSVVSSLSIGDSYHFSVNPPEMVAHASDTISHNPDVGSQHPEPCPRRPTSCLHEPVASSEEKSSGSFPVDDSVVLGPVIPRPGQIAMLIRPHVEQFTIKYI